MALLGLTSLAVAQIKGGPLDYQNWTNKEGREFVARVIQVYSEDKIFLEAKVGARKHTIDTSVLSEDSKKLLAELTEQARADLETNGYDAKYVNAAFRFGLIKSGWTCTGRVEKFYIGNRTAEATILLEGGVADRLTTDYLKYRFFKSGDNLMLTPIKGASLKDTRPTYHEYYSSNGSYYFYRGVKRARRANAKASGWIQATKGTIVEVDTTGKVFGFEQVGVTPSLVIEQWVAPSSELIPVEPN